MIRGSCLCGALRPVAEGAGPRRRIAIAPLAGLDDPPPLLHGEPVWTADVPAWSGIHDPLRRYEGPPPCWGPKVDPQALVVCFAHADRDDKRPQRPEPGSMRGAPRGRSGAA